jgi:hypothetical protein
LWLWSIDFGAKGFSNFDVFQGWILRNFKDCASHVVIKFQKISQSLWQNIAMIVMWGENLDKRWSLGWNNHKTHFPVGLVRLLIPLLSRGLLNLALKQSYKFYSIVTRFKTLNPCVIDDWMPPLKLWFFSKKMVVAMHLPPCYHWHTCSWKLTHSQKLKADIQVFKVTKAWSKHATKTWSKNPKKKKSFAHELLFCDEQNNSTWNFAHVELGTKLCFALCLITF